MITIMIIQRFPKVAFRQVPRLGQLLSGFATALSQPDIYIYIYIYVYACNIYIYI